MLFSVGFVLLMAFDIVAHKLADYLRCRSILLAAQFKELFAKLALDPDTQSRIFHQTSVAVGYTVRQTQLKDSSTAFLLASAIKRRNRLPG
ncbi:MAG: hypothetical protein TEF_22015 [Rhizobiales bacterium NRL2]|nr:MAG: hypothetical protein TEF_22015 [Rhizobiales bacterium NRL2]